MICMHIKGILSTYFLHFMWSQIIHKKDDRLLKYTEFLGKLAYVVLGSKSYYINWHEYSFAEVNESKQDRVLNRIKDLNIQKQEWSVIISVLEISYNITKAVFLMKNVSHMHKNICYEIYSLSRKLDETLCISTSNKEGDKKKCILHKLMRMW